MSPIRQETDQSDCIGIVGRHCGNGRSATALSRITVDPVAEAEGKLVLVNSDTYHDRILLKLNHYLFPPRVGFEFFERKAATDSFQRTERRVGKYHGDVWHHFDTARVSLATTFR